MVGLKTFFELIRLNHFTGNLAYFILGLVLLWSIKNEFSISAIAGLISLFLAYSSVYVFNDVIDLKEDKKHHISWKRNRPLPTGRVSIKTAKWIAALLSVGGIIIAYNLNPTFFMIIISITLLNFIYSYLKIKRVPTIGISLLTIIQILKMMTGWSSVTASLNGFPVFLILSLSFSYALLMSVYKKPLFKKKSSYYGMLLFYGLPIMPLYILSIMIYATIRWALITFVVIIILTSIPARKVFKKEKINKHFRKFIYVIPSLLFSLSLLILLLS